MICYVEILVCVCLVCINKYGGLDPNVGPQIAHACVLYLLKMSTILLGCCINLHHLYFFFVR
jgi:hypothetical protein